MKLVDTHCHLNLAPLAENPPAVLARARQAGVVAVVALAYDLPSFDAVEQLASLPGVLPALGLHPWVAGEPLEAAGLEARLKGCGAVAIGEIGLDFQIDGCDKPRQVAVLEQQLHLAQRLDLPVLLHCRGAYEELLEILRQFEPRVRGVVHAFSRSPQLMKRFLELGLHIGFGGAVTRLNAERARRAAALCPASRLVLETDAPSIGLEGVPPEQVEPRHILDIARCVADLRHLSLEEVADLTTSNAAALFGPRLLAP